MFRFFKSKTNLNAFTDGEFIKLKDVSDPVFAQGMLGEGFAIKPTSENIYSPVKGKVAIIYPTLHAYGIITDKGTEIILHLGIDTVKLEGKGFESYVKLGDSIEVGDRIAKINLEIIEEYGFDNTCICVVSSKEKVKIIIENSRISTGDLIGIVQ